jgi:hypothetical protein
MTKDERETDNRRLALTEACRFWREHRGYCAGEHEDVLKTAREYFEFLQDKKGSAE